MYSQHPKLAKEFEAATPEGAKLPEHVKKMAEGGEVNKPDEFTNGIKEGVNGDLDKLKQFFEGMHRKPEGDNATLPGFRSLMQQAHPAPSTPTVKPSNMAVGGQVPPLGQVMTNLNQTPATNYDFYKDISAEDRNKLYQQLNQQQHGGGQAAISGLAGLGDAIANSYGGQHNQFQKGVQEQSQNNMNQQLGAMDTQRSQRLQDMQGNQEMMMNDPNHPIAAAMRQTLKGMGVNVPSGMNSALMVKVLGPMGDLALKQATLGQQGAHYKAEEDIARTGLAQSKTKAEQDAADKAAQQKFEGAKGVNARPWYQKAAEMIPGLKSESTKVMEQQMGGDSQMAPGPHGATITQNGHTYTWNGKTYE